MRWVVIVLLAFTIGLASTAHADPSDDDCSGRQDGGVCQDNDVSSSFDNGPVIICVQPDSCRFKASLVLQLAPSATKDIG